MQKVYFMLLTALLLMCLTASLATAATYYVDVNNPAASNDNIGSEALPWSTIDNGELRGVLAAGDTIIVKPGTYNVLQVGPTDSQAVVYILMSGAPGSPITYKASGPGVVIDGGATGAIDYLLIGWAVGDGNTETPIHDIVIDGFEFTGAGCGVSFESAKNLTVKNCIFHDLYAPSYTGVEGDRRNGNIVCVYGKSGADCSYPDNKFYSIGEAIEAACYWIRGCSNASIVRNLMYGFTNDGVRALAVIEGCSNTQLLNNTCGGGSNLIRPFSGSSGTVVTNNIIANCTECGIGNWDGTAAVTNSYNLFFSCAANWGGSAAPGVNEFTADPLFVGGDDYHLQATSPAINSGLDVGQLFTGPFPDLGCFETDSTAAQSFVAGKFTMGSNSLPVSGGMIEVIGTGNWAKTPMDGTYRIALAPDFYTVKATFQPYSVTPDSPEVVVSANATTVQDFHAAMTPKTYHVDCSSPVADDTNPGTEELPWLNIDAGDAQQVLAPGDTVLVHPGTYYPYFPLPAGHLIAGYVKACSGTPGFPITYQATGPGVVIDGQNIDGAFTCGFYTNGGHDIVIDGFEFTGLVFGVCQDGASRYTIRNCKFHDMYASDMWGKSIWCIFDNVGSDSVFTDNVFYSNSSPTAECDAFWVQHGGGHVISRNVKYGFTTPSVSAFTVVNHCAGVKLLNNTCDGGTNLIRPFAGSSGTIVANNIIVNCTESGIGNWDGPEAITNSYNLFYNCAANWGGNCSEGTGEFTADPLFIGGSPFDYHLQSTSPAIDKGTNVGFSFKGSAPDIGAYEFESPNPPVPDIVSLKKLTPGSSFSLTSAVVATMSSPGSAFEGIYVEDPYRVTGVKVLAAAGSTLPAISEGDMLTFAGTLDRDANGELCAYVSSINSQTSGTALGALGMTNKALPAGDKGAGLLVTIWGNVTAAPSGAIYIDDGSGIDDGLGIARGIRVILNGLAAPTSGMVAVTGEAGLLTEGGKTITVIRPRVAADIR